MSKYRIQTKDEIPGWQKRVNPLEKKLATVEDAPRGLSEAERLIWVDIFNSIFVLPFATEKQAKAVADSFIEQSDIK